MNDLTIDWNGFVNSLEILNDNDKFGKNDCYKTALNLFKQLALNDKIIELTDGQEFLTESEMQI